MQAFANTQVQGGFPITVALAESSNRFAMAAKDLGLTLETVSRTLSAFNEIGLISVDQRSIGIKDIDALRTLRRLPPSSARAKAAGRRAKSSTSSMNQ